MKKRVIAILMSLSMVIGIVGCGAGASTAPESQPESQPEFQESDNTQQQQSAAEEPAATDNASANAVVDVGRLTSLLGDEEVIYYDKDLVPSVQPYSVAEDFSNVVYDKPYAYLFDPSLDSEYNDATGLRNALIKNGFAVRKGYESEFFDIYEDNRYFSFPSFVTVDSLMHTYHLYFAYLMKSTEKSYLSDQLKTLSATMLKETAAQYEIMKLSLIHI